MDKKERRNAEIEIDLIPLLKALLSKAWLMILVGVIVAGVAFGASKVLIKPTYRCGFTAYVNNQQTQANKDILTSSDLVAAQHLTKTFSHIIRSNTVLTASLESMGSDLTYNEFSRMVSTEIMDDTELISIYVVNKDPRLAYELSNAIAQTAPTYVADIVEGSSMNIVDYPVYTDARYKPSYVKFAFLGFLAGVLLIVIICIIKYFTNDTIKNEGDIEARFEIPVLGVIPDMTETSDKKSGYYAYDYSYESAQRNRKKER